MRFLLMLLLSSISLQSYSQMIDFDGDGLTEIADAHFNSIEVKKVIRELEYEYGVKCINKASVFLPSLKSKIKTHIFCPGEKLHLRLKVVSSFELEDKNIKFQLLKYSIKVENL